jgi:oligopeptide/dipeptide ABC transporter ATP-binding protein
MPDENEVLLTVSHLKKYFPVKGGFFKTNYVKAVDDISFSINKGETMGLVGESGCGKSTLVRTLLRLTEPTSGSLLYRGLEISGLPRHKLQEQRKNMQMVFQDPFASLPPSMRVRGILEEPLIINKVKSKSKRMELVHEITEKVGLKPEHLNRYPHEFSGGQRQRIVIARALVTKPQLIILDEPVSALDISIRSQILNLLADLQTEMSLTYLFISHDLSVVEHICKRVMIMYLGHIMETGSREDIFEHPKHPYTKALLSSIPQIGGGTDKSGRIILQGDIPSPINPPSGCVFRTRCAYCAEICMEPTEIEEVEPGAGHRVACHRWKELDV